MLFAEMTPGDWLAIAGMIGGGLATGGGTLGAAIRFAFSKYADIRKEERTHEAVIAAKFTESAEKIQQQAAEDNRKALEDGRKAFATLIEIQRDAMKAVAAVVSALEKLDASVTELRSEVTGRKSGKRRPRAADANGADSEQ